MKDLTHIMIFQVDGREPREANQDEVQYTDIEPRYPMINSNPGSDESNSRMYPFVSWYNSYDKVDDHKYTDHKPDTTSSWAHYFFGSDDKDDKADKKHSYGVGVKKPLREYSGPFLYPTDAFDKPENPMGVFGNFYLQPGGVSLVSPKPEIHHKYHDPQLLFGGSLPKPMNDFAESIMKPINSFIDQMIKPDYQYYEKPSGALLQPIYKPQLPNPEDSFISSIVKPANTFIDSISKPASSFGESIWKPDGTLNVMDPVKKITEFITVPANNIIDTIPKPADIFDSITKPVSNFIDPANNIFDSLAKPSNTLIGNKPLGSSPSQSTVLNSPFGDKATAVLGSIVKPVNSLVSTISKPLGTSILPNGIAKPDDSNLLTNLIPSVFSPGNKLGSSESKVLVVQFPDIKQSISNGIDNVS